MKELYESKISDVRWWLYDIPGSIGWILYFVCTVRMLRQEFSVLSTEALVPAILMLVGIMELISIYLSIVQEQLAQLHLQQDNICEYLEKEIYTIEMFTKRNEALMKELRKLQASEKDLLDRKASKKEVQTAEAEIIPTTQRILDSYPRLSVVEKNSLWKIVMEKITMYRTPDGEFSMHIYPKLPMKN